MRVNPTRYKGSLTSLHVGSAEDPFDKKLHFLHNGEKSKRSLRAHKPGQDFPHSLAQLIFNAMERVEGRSAVFVKKMLFMNTGSSLVFAYRPMKSKCTHGAKVYHKKYVENKVCLASSIYIIWLLIKEWLLFAQISFLPTSPTISHKNSSQPPI